MSRTWNANTIQDYVNQYYPEAQTTIKGSKVLIVLRKAHKLIDIQDYEGFTHCLRVVNNFLQ